MDYIYGKLSNVTNINEFIERIEECEYKVDECESQVASMTERFDEAMIEFGGLRDEVHSYSGRLTKAEQDSTYAVDKANEVADIVATYDNLLETIQNNINNLQTNKEDKSNKVNSWSQEPNDINYPSEKLVKDNLDTLNTNISNETSRAQGVEEFISSHVSELSGTVQNNYNILDTKINTKQNTINSENKLDADLIEDGVVNKVYTSDEKTKLAGIESGAQVNPQSLKNPYSLNINEAGINKEYDGSEAISISIPNITNLATKNEAVGSISLTIDSTTYEVKLQAKDVNGTNIGDAQVIDLPIESVVVSGSYDSTNKKIVLVLNNGNSIDIPVGDLINGLQTEITSNNKLASDLVDDTNQTNKFVTSNEKATWNAKSDFSGNYNDLNNKPDLSIYVEKSQTNGLLKNDGTVDTTQYGTSNFSGDYNDLINKPTIPVVPSNITQSITVDGITYNPDANGNVDLGNIGGGGSIYTAGTGINITNNVISVDSGLLANCIGYEEVVE